MASPTLAIFTAIEYLEPTENLCAATKLLRILRMTRREGLSLAHEVDGLVDAHTTEQREYELLTWNRLILQSDVC